VTSAADGNQNIMLTSEADAGDHIGGAGTARNHSGPAVNHGVGNDSHSIIARLPWAE
jgi:hypothetical protein